mmetsp:Transcript_17307/g.42278  ORF Transcript_17307/g.42278 Transcript_17307/m.42278 type:complete len:271 (+) Transcript_17307:2567-3379(+)
MHDLLSGPVHAPNVGTALSGLSPHQLVLPRRGNVPCRGGLVRLDLADFPVRIPHLCVPRQGAPSNLDFEPCHAAPTNIPDDRAHRDGRLCQHLQRSLRARKARAVLHTSHCVKPRGRLALGKQLDRTPTFPVPSSRYARIRSEDEVLGTVARCDVDLEGRGPLDGKLDGIPFARGLANRSKLWKRKLLHSYSPSSVRRAVPAISHSTNPVRSWGIDSEGEVATSLLVEDSAVKGVVLPDLERPGRSSLHEARDVPEGALARALGPLMHHG